MKKQYITPKCDVCPLMSPPRLLAGSDTSLYYYSSGTPIDNPEDIH